MYMYMNILYGLISKKISSEDIISVWFHCCRLLRSRLIRSRRIREGSTRSVITDQLAMDPLLIKYRDTDQAL